MSEILINGRFLSRRITGVERYAREILARLPGMVRIAQPRRGMQGTRGHGWEQFFLPSYLRSGDLLWSPANTGPLCVKRQILSLHDLSWLEHPEWYDPAFALWYRVCLPVLVRRVRRLLVPSEHVRQKVLARFALSPHRVIVIPEGVDRNRFRMQPGKPGRFPRPYLLFVGSLQPRKNLAVLLQAWAQVQPRFPDMHLLVSGAKSPNSPKVALQGDPDRVKFLGYVPDDDLPFLYAGARLFVFPSLDEGFGLPALEAMACGVPIVAAAAGALREVIGPAGLFFSPHSANELAAAIERCLTDERLRRILIDCGQERAQAFSWQDAARKTWEVFQTCL